MSIFSTIINYLFPPDPSTPASPPAPSVSPLNPPRSPLRYFSTPTAPEHHHLTPSPRDIQQVTAILSKRLPPELVPRILEFAEYFSGCRRFNPRKFNVTAGGVLPRGKRGVLFSTGQETELQVEMAMEGSGLKDELGNYWYLVSEPVGCGDHDGEEEEESDRPPSWLRGIVLETKSKDQGWTSANPQFYGTYEGSYSWFELSLLRDGTEVAGSRMSVQNNVHAGQYMKAHKKVFDHTHPLVRQAKSGDRVVLWVRAQYPGWSNEVSEAAITLYTSLYGYQ